MNTVYRCSKCKEVFVVSSIDPQMHLLKSSMRCPNAIDCKGKMRVQAKTNIKMANAKTMGALELYQASLGVGAPTERRCSPADMKKVLVGSKIVDLQTEVSPDPMRTIIHSLTLDSGKVIHLAASTKGATIFKVTEKTNGR